MDSIARRSERPVFLLGLMIVDMFFFFNSILVLKLITAFVLADVCSLGQNQWYVR